MASAALACQTGCNLQGGIDYSVIWDEMMPNWWMLHMMHGKESTCDKCRDRKGLELIGKC